MEKVKSKSKSAKAKGRARRSLRTKFAGMTAFLVVALMVVVTSFVVAQERDALGREVRARGATIASNLAANASEAMFAHDDLSLAVLVKGSVQGEDTVEPEKLNPWDQILKEITY